MTLQSNTTGEIRRFYNNFLHKPLEERQKFTASTFPAGLRDGAVFLFRGSITCSVVGWLNYMQARSFSRFTVVSARSCSLTCRFVNVL